MKEERHEPEVRFAGMSRGDLLKPSDAQVAEFAGVTEKLRREVDILSLRDVTGEHLFPEQVIAHMRVRGRIDPNDCRITGKGLKRILQLLIWRLVKWIPGWMLFRVNAVTEQLTLCLEFEMQERKRLELRVSELERRLVETDAES